MTFRPESRKLMTPDHAFEESRRGRPFNLAIDVAGAPVNLVSLGDGAVWRAT